VDRKSPSSLRAPERNSKIRAGILNEGLAYTFYKIKFKLFAVFGFTELLRVIYKSDEIVFSLKNKPVRTVSGKGRREMDKFTKLALVRMLQWLPVLVPMEHACRFLLYALVLDLG
jgi:hypothetical protein